MATSPDIRPPCDGKPGQILRFVGGCFQHTDRNLAAIKVKYNVTKMKDYASGSDYKPEGIDPYSFAEQTTAPDCSPYNNGGCPDNPCYHCGATGGSGNGNLPCGQPLTSDILACNANSGTFDVGPYHNCYSQSNDTKSFSDCRHLGFKNAYAHKAFHGVPAYNSRLHGQLDAWQWCCTCTAIGHFADETVDKTRYLGITANSNTHTHTNVYTCTSTDAGTCECPGDPDPITINNSCPSCTLDHELDVYGTATATSHVDRYTGNSINTCSSGSSGNCDTGTPEENQVCQQSIADYALGLTGLASFDINVIVGVFCGRIPPGPADVVIDGGGSSKHVEWHQTQTCYDHCGNITLENDFAYLTMDIDSVAGTLDIYTNGINTTVCGRTTCTCGDCCDPIIQTSHYHYSFGTTTMAYSADVTGIGSISLDQTYHEDAGGSLYDPYTTDQLYQDVVDLLNYLPLDRDDLLPWRRDGNVTKGPVVFYDEHQNSPSVPQCTNDTSSTGDIYGIPAPAGIDHVWNPSHKNYCICDSLVQPGCLSFYIKSWGAWNDEIGGGSPTAWLDDYESNNIMQGAFVGNGFFFTVPSTCNSNGPSQILGGDLWGAKYAEVIINPKPSINFARPCGADRFVISQSTETYISSIAGNVLSIEPTGPDTIAQAGQYVWVCGTPDLDGCWIASAAGGHSVTLQEPRVVSASVLPYLPIANCGTGIVAPLRWQNLQPAICGKLFVESATRTSPITISLESATWLVDGDKIIIENAIGGNINGLWEVVVIDPSNVILSGSNGISASVYHGESGLASSPFAPNWKWNDSNPKNDFEVIKWNFNNRDVGEWLRLTQSVPFQEAQAQCDGLTQCPVGHVPPEPRPFEAGCFDQTVEQLTCDTSCLTWNACAPNVAFFSPNSESFKSSSAIVSSRNYGWGKVDYDPQYGSMWKGVIKQAIDDPFWQAPPCPPEAVTDPDTLVTTYECNCSWLQDDGNCNADQPGDPDLMIPCIRYYAKAPQVEGRCEPPSGSPALPSGKYLGCLKPADFTSPTCPQGNVCFSPFADANSVYNLGPTCNAYWVYPYATPWITYLAELNCVCSNGRFAPDYERALVLCDEQQFLPPP